MGKRVNAGLIGSSTDMTNLERGDLKMQFDFRQVYASLLEDWMSLKPDTIVGDSFEKLKILKSYD